MGDVTAIDSFFMETENKKAYPEEVGLKALEIGM